MNVRRRRWGPWWRLSAALGVVGLVVGLSLIGCASREESDTAVLELATEIEAPTALALAPAPASPGSAMRFQRITVQDGLSQNAVLAITQDQRGYMWFATEDGLNKYDGTLFTVFKHDEQDPSSLADSFVSSLWVDSQGELWVGTRNGLDRYDRSSGAFVHYELDPGGSSNLASRWVVAIYEDREGTLWVGTDGGGLISLNSSRDVVYHYQHDPADPRSLATASVRAILEDRDGLLWVGTSEGLDCLDRRTGVFTHFRHAADDPSSLSDDAIWTIFEDNQGLLWVGTETGGLNRFDPATQTFSRYQHDADDPARLSHDRVRAILESKTGRLWIGTQNGLDWLDREREAFVHYQHSPYDPYSLSSSSVWSIYEDAGGVLWFGTYGGGVNRYNRATDQFALYQHNPGLPSSLSDNMVWSIAEDQDGALWIGTFNGGLNRLERASGEFTVFRHEPENPLSLSDDDVRAILPDRGGQLWVGTSAGLDRYDPTTGAFVHYVHDPDDPNSLSGLRVTAIHEDQRGNLWIGTRQDGLNRLDRATGQAVRYRYDPNDAESLCSDRIWALQSDRAGNLWVGTLGGVCVLDVEANRFTRYNHDPSDPTSLANDSVFAFYEDPAGIMWVGTWGSGLDRFDPATGAFSHYTEDDGLANNVIYGILPDSAGNLWLSTNKGISRFDPKADTFRNYDVSDGLQDNEFNVGAHFRSETGELFLGGVQGFNAFFPERIVDNPIPPPVVITAFRLFNQVVRTDLLPDEHIALSYRDNFISFEFAALDYAAPEKNLYAYMLEGQDKQWVEAGARRHADYTNLRGGDYTFRVRGSNSDGVWNETGSAVRLTVTPPVWERWWFRGTALAIIVAAGVGGYMMRVRSVEARSRQLAVQVEERTREIEWRTQQLEALYRADEELYRHLHLDEVLQALVDIAVDTLHADKSMLLVWDAERQRYVTRSSRGFSSAARTVLSFARDEGLVAEVIASGGPVIVEDAHSDPRRADEPEDVMHLAEVDGIRSSIHVPVHVGGEVFGIFNAAFDTPHAFDADEQRLFVALAQRGALAIENAQLYEQAQELAVVAERQRLARDLHDAVTQTLFSASLIAEVLPRIWSHSPEEGMQRLEEVRQMTRGALAEMRTLLLELRPTALMEADLGGLLRQLAEAINGRARVPVAVEVEGECTCAPHVKVALYRIAQEALNNVAKHANATEARVSLRCGPEGMKLHISDDGRGFDVESVPPDHLGLTIMRERADAIGADLTIESISEAGTTVTVVWPGKGTAGVC